MHLTNYDQQKKKKKKVKMMIKTQMKLYTLRPLSF